MIDIQVFIAVFLCGIGGFALYYTAKVIFIFGWLITRGISYTNWCLKTISTEGQAKWDTTPFYNRWWQVVTHVFESIPTVINSNEITKGDCYWKSIRDHKP
jgi:hypothetical protein